jgi:BolA protein
VSVATGRPDEHGATRGGPAHGATDTTARADVPAMLRVRLAPLEPAALEILDESAAHAGHAGAAGGGGHFSLTIVSKAFSGLSRLARHQRVLREVSDLLPHTVHALSIRALAPDEFPS